MTSLPFKLRAINSRGMSKLMMAGINTLFIMANEVICPPIQSIVVVTSPIGVQAPPAFAAMMIMPANNKRSSYCSKIFFIKETITIVVVKLSKMALRKKVTMPTIHMRFCKLFVLIRLVITSKP